MNVELSNLDSGGMESQVAQLADGFYAAFVAGKAGESVVLLVFKQGVVCGTDMTGAMYDGTYVPASDGKSNRIMLDVSIPPGTVLIQGGLSQGETMRVEGEVPVTPDAEYFSLQTPNGPVNIKLQFIRNLEP